MGNNSILQVKGLSKAFPGVQALDGVDMEVGAGEVHCLVGENGSGKSTLIKAVSGAQDFDAGEIVLNGRSYTSLTARQAMDEGVQVIYQDMSLFPQLSVAENIAFTWMVHNTKKFVSPNLMAERAKYGLEQLGEDLDLWTPVRELSMSAKQIVAIARSIVLDAKIIFMDEPTTALSKSEIDALFRIINNLRDKGIATVFVSHKLDEVFRVSENITVLRDGKKVGDFESHGLNEESLAYHMTGTEVLYDTYDYAPVENAPPILSVENLTREPHYRNLSLEVRPGEVVGITGPLGAGRTEFALSLFGLNPPEQGTIRLNGQQLSISDPEVAIEAGIGLVPEDRHAQGMFEKMPINDNLIAGVLSRITRRGFIDSEKAESITETWFKRLKIKASSSDVLAKTLSGGNQQRVVIAKWLATEPNLLILDGPTVGIDIASKSAIHEMVHDLARRGMGIIIISDEIPEVYKNSTRIVVMRDGEFIYESTREGISQEDLRNLVEIGVPA